MECEQKLPTPVSVLLVEDSDGDARLVREFLRERSASDITFELTRASSLADALTRLKEGRFHVILLDLWLPDSSGAETILRIRPECPGIPLVVLTGNSDQHIGVEALNAGAQDFFVKGRLDASLLAKALLRQAMPNRAGARENRPAAAVRVLLVEDNPADARLLEEFLLHDPIRGVVFQVTVAARLAEAFEQLDRSQFDVVLLDLWLPDSAGVQTVARVRARKHDIPVIVITGDTDEQVASEALRAGAQDFLPKGNLDAALLIERLLRQVRQQDAA